MGCEGGECWCGGLGCDGGGGVEGWVVRVVVVWRVGL